MRNMDLGEGGKVGRGKVVFSAHNIYVVQFRQALIIDSDFIE